MLVAFPFVVSGVMASSFGFLAYPAPTAKDDFLLRDRVEQAISALGRDRSSDDAPGQVSLPALPPLDGKSAEPNLGVFEHDEDADGLPDFAESFYGTNPRLADSDGDGYPDGEEVRFGYHPLGFGKMESLTPPSP